MSRAGAPGVSRETEEKLAAFEALVRKWNPAINLVARSTLPDLRVRHIEDSLQLVDIAPEGTTHWADIGSGGGFPGLVVAIAGPDRLRDLRVTLVESDQRKATFLRTAARELSLAVEVLDARIETLPPLGADVLSARALAPLGLLLAHASRHLAQSGVGLFPKGTGADEEIAAALEHWRFNLQKVPSNTDPDGVILRIGGITRV